SLYRARWCPALRRRLNTPAHLGEQTRNVPSSNPLQHPNLRDRQLAWPQGQAQGRGKPPGATDMDTIAGMGSPGFKPFARAMAKLVTYNLFRSQGRTPNAKLEGPSSTPPSATMLTLPNRFTLATRSCELTATYNLPA